MRTMKDLETSLELLQTLSQPVRKDQLPVHKDHRPVPTVSMKTEDEDDEYGDEEFGPPIQSAPSQDYEWTLYYRDLYVLTDGGPNA